MSASACITAAAVMLSKDMASFGYKIVAPSLVNLVRCYTVDESVSARFISSFIAIICFECAIFFLCIYKILELRRTATSPIPLVDRLWQDGMWYFTFIILLSAANIALCLRADHTQLRSGSSHLQAALHSMIACRILIHLAQFTREQDDGIPRVSSPYPYEHNYPRPNRRQFTSRFSIDNPETWSLPDPDPSPTPSFSTFHGVSGDEQEIVNSNLYG